MSQIKFFPFTSAQLDELISSDGFQWLADTHKNKDFRDLLTHHNMNYQSLGMPFKEIGAEGTVDDIAVFLRICHEEHKRSGMQLIQQAELDEALPFAGTPEHMDALIAVGSQLEGVDVDGRTALHTAAERGYDDTVEWLVERGANIAATDNSGLTPAEVAAQEGHRKIHDYLRFVETSRQADMLNNATAQPADAWSPGDLSGDHLVPKAQGECQAPAQRQSRRL